MNRLMYGVLLSFISIGIHALDETFSLMSWNILSPQADDIARFTSQDGKKTVFQSGQPARIKLQSQYILRQKPKNDRFVVCLQDVDAQSLQIFTQNLGTKQYQVATTYQKNNTGASIFTKGFRVLEKDYIDIAGTSAIGCWTLLEEEKFVKEKHTVLIVNLYIDQAQADYNKFENSMWEAIVNKIPFNKANSVMLAGDFGLLYKQVNESLVPLLNKNNSQFAMYEHSSLTKTDFDGTFASVDHILYRSLMIESGRAEAIDENVENYDRSVKAGQQPIYLKKYGMTINKQEGQKEYGPLSNHTPLFVQVSFDLSSDATSTKKRIDVSQDAADATQRDLLQQQIQELTLRNNLLREQIKIMREDNTELEVKNKLLQEQIKKLKTAAS